MYIKSIKAHGFKSFADKINLDFNPGISAIVGPNGSGKSNVVDAILWVLGEQSIKSLRGEALMSDVIFSGTNKREELKKASVSILFDNSDHTLNTEFNEVEIKRIIYKSGENEYYINNARVRLKDVTDLLIDVTSKFNIISQGNINALVENKSSERRILFESAAGVLKYKKRKEESLRKLDGTKENLTRINLIINELLTTLTPLESQKEEAKQYLEIKKSLESTDIALITNDISNLSEKNNKLKIENENYKKELDILKVNHPEVLEKLKLDNIKLDEEITNINKEISVLSDAIASLNSQKTLAVERSTYKLDKNTVDINLLSLKEKKITCQKDIDILNNKLTTIKKEFQDTINLYNTSSDLELKSKIKVNNYNNDYNLVNKEILELQNKINIANYNNENNSYLPKSVSSIINNPRLKGIHNIIGNVVEVNESHKIAINTALGASSNFIITDNLASAKNAINYLKENRLGRATFFPIDTIKSRRLSKDIEYTIASLNGYIGIASDLIECNKEYKNIIENQLGNVIVVDEMDDLFDIAKTTDYKYKMVTLDGEIIYPGGSIAGGDKQTNSFDKSIINKLKTTMLEKKGLLDSINITIKNENKIYSDLIEKNSELNKKIAQMRITIDNEQKEYDKNLDNMKSITNNISDLENINTNTIDESIEKLLDEIGSKTKDREILSNKNSELVNEKFDLTNKIASLEKELHDQNINYHRVESYINNNEIEIAKIGVRIDNLLSELANDYNITYEYAFANYNLDIDNDIARSQVSELKSKLKKLSNVNLGSIDEYDRLKKRYDFLSKQKEDLDNASNELLDIILEMDDIMKDKFKKTFDAISKEFTKIFRIMFKGGNGLLKLADESDLLNTGIDILAVPPGKKLNSTAFLSGGEKALTAICLIFAILNVKPVPFIVLDEAEAALDEENVRMFGDYLLNMKNSSQFILITHKKKMMEYADILYGITMEESGVSKLVSVKLEN